VERTDWLDDGLSPADARRTRPTSALSARSTIGPWPPGIAARASAARLALAWLSCHTSSRICMICSTDSRLVTSSSPASAPDEVDVASQGPVRY
jgi:hypothetical protein